MNALINFNFEKHLVRVVTIESEPWWVATDVARVLGFTRAPDMVRQLDDDEKGVHNLHTLGGNQQLSIVSLSGVLHATLKSRRPEAQKFRRWVTGEVLPQILHTGKYALYPANDDDGRGVRNADTLRGYDPNWLNAHVAWVRIVKQLEGPSAARRALAGVGLSRAIAAIPDQEGAFVSLYKDEFLTERLMEWLDANEPRPTLADVVAGLGYDIEHEEMRDRVRAAMTSLGWWSKKARGWSGEPSTCWFPPEQAE